jgi:creatinine amidohydrolase
MRMDEMTTEEFRAAVSKDPVIIVPIGGTEAHGPHLPLGSDTFQPEYIAEKVSESVEGVIVAPTMPYGQHSSMRAFAGTVTLSFDTLRSFVRDILSSLSESGVKKIVLISGHAGNSHLCAITEACREFVRDNDVSVMFFSDYFIAEEYEKCQIDGDGHAGMVETSRVMDIRPELVNDIRPVGKFRGCGYMVLPDASECFPDMMQGDTRGASAAFGKEINDFVITRVADMIRRDF